MRTVTIIRHARSTANEKGQTVPADATELAFANRSAELTPRGESECDLLAPRLPGEYGITPSTTPVAVSTFERTKLTAVRLGFVVIERYPQLDEVEYNMDLEELRERLKRNEIPEIAREAGRAALNQAPSENVWVTHGLLIAGICIELGIAGQYDRPVPRQCEVREIVF